MALSACPGWAARHPGSRSCTGSHSNGHGRPRPLDIQGCSVRSAHASLHITRHQHETVDPEMFLRRERKCYWLWVNLNCLHLWTLGHPFSFSLFFCFYMKMFTFVKRGLLERELYLGPFLNLFHCSWFLGASVFTLAFLSGAMNYAAKRSCKLGLLPGYPQICWSVCINLKNLPCP